MKAQSSSPGIYAVFKLYLVVQFFFDLSATMVRFATLPPAPQQLRPPPPMPPGSPSFFGVMGIAPMISLVSIFFNVFLLGYLSWGWLQKRLGILHLPFALALATASPLFIDFWSGFQYRDHLMMMRGSYSPWMDQSFYQFALSGQFQVSLLVLMPLTLVAWRYRYHWVVFYCLLITGISMVSVGILILNMNTLGRVFWVILSRLLYYLVFGYIISRLVNDQRQITVQLEAANRSLVTSANTMEQLTISRERNRLAREVHDTLAHTLSAVAVQLEAVNTLWENNSQKAYQILRQSLSQTRQGLYETRRAIQALRASPLDDLGLLLAIKSLANSTADRCGFTIDLDLPDELTGLTQEVEHSLYRIIEEALHNVSDHALAERVTLYLGRRDDKLSLSIQDDGLGFDPARIQEKEHYGLRGIKERAEAMGAQFRLETQPGKGTRISLEWVER